MNLLLLLLMFISTYNTIRPPPIHNGREFMSDL